MDLVGALGLPYVPRQAQGLRLRRDPFVAHVPVAARSQVLTPAAATPSRLRRERHLVFLALQLPPPWGLFQVPDIDLPDTEPA